MTTLKQKKATTLIMESHGKLPVSRAMLEAGYDPTTAKNPKNLTESKGWKELLEKHLPDNRLLEVHNEALDAVKIVSSHTEPDYTVPDVPTRLRAVELGYKVKGKLQPDTAPLEPGEMRVQFREKE